jgi:hypothetical protein
MEYLIMGRNSQLTGRINEVQSMYMFGIALLSRFIHHRRKNISNVGVAISHD